MLTLIIAEAALEIIPKSIWRFPSVIKQSKSREKKPGEMLLDRSYHHFEMLKLKYHTKRGRPDLIHFALLEITSTPLYLENRLNVCVHTFNDKVIFLGKSVKLPKSYFRFEGLMENLFKDRKIVSNDQCLLEILDMNFKELLDKIKASYVIGLSRRGLPSSFENIVNELKNKDRPVLVVGGFPHGHFSENTSRYLKKTSSINHRGLASNVVIARIIYEYEKLFEK